jgi:tRNA dimethylallyltransferase
MRFPPDLLRRCWVLAGPTASGKSAAGIALAERIGGEILSLDSMAVYRGMDVGTAKPPHEDRRRVPHHLIDLVDPHESFSVADYLRAAEATCRDVVARGNTPLFVGGTGLYLRSLLRGVFEGPSAAPEVRQRLEAEAASMGAEALHARLRTVDPTAAARLHPNDVRRVVRALEVAELTGRPLSAQHDHPPLPESERPRHVYWLSPPRAWLYERIDRRVDAMMAAGLLDETRRLLAQPKGLGKTARQALGYRELIDHLEGRLALADAIDLIKLRTRQFAKRQHTWFRNLEECRPVEITGEESPDQIADRIARLPQS